ncbi:MAG: rhodanese-like domain-containing protein [Anaerolineales bacterium]
MKTSKLRTIFKIIRVILHRVTKGTWYLPAVSEITAEDLLDRVNSSTPPILIDLRSAEEFNGWYGHIPDARWIPMLELGSNLEDLQSFKEREIVTICPGGGMSLAGAEILAEAGFRDVKSLRGGLDLWYKKGYPTTRSSDKEGLSP